MAADLFALGVFGPGAGFGFGRAAKAVPQLPPGYPPFSVAKRAMGSPGKGNVYERAAAEKAAAEKAVAENAAA